MQFLMGLNESYSIVRGKILLNEPLPNINKVLSLILQEEKQRNVDCGLHSMIHQATEVIAFYINTKGNYGGNGNFKREGPVCTYYGENCSYRKQVLQIA